jgi:hypothetical protein
LWFSRTFIWKKRIKHYPQWHLHQCLGLQMFIGKIVVV